MMPTLHIHLLGDFHLMLDDRVITSVIPPRVQSLLAYLVLHSQTPLSRQRLAFLFWPDSTEDQARNNLRQSFHLLRQTLPHSKVYLRSDAQTLQWLPEAPFTLDVTEFEEAIKRAESVTALQHAVDLYRGELLAGCYEDWILPERERLQQQLIELLERLLRLCENQHDYRSAIQYAERLLRSDPLREETYQLLIRLHALNGNRTGALRAYQMCVTVLKRELDVGPSPETLAAYEESQNIEIATTRLEPSPKRRTNNLPAYLTSFIGRKEEFEHLKRLLTWQDATSARTRLITLTGAGGCGKTRLAVELATQLLETFPDGVWFVDLAPLTNPTLIPQAIATVLEVQEQSGRALLDTLSDYLQSKTPLLILDNCEHLVAACAQVAQSLLQACPRLRILATSIEKLNVMGEKTWAVSSLSLPDANDQVTTIASRSDAVNLFVERACSVLPTFTLNANNAAAIVQICQHLDGVPLAIELAAARVTVLTTEQIAARLGDTLQLLTRGGYTTRPHHQTLRATIGWSYELLPQKERILFQRLAVFVGGFTLDAAEQVCADQDDHAVLPQAEILDVLSRLIDKSLVTAVEWESDQMRYRMLETIRQYAHEKLVNAGEEAHVRRCHAEFFAQWAEHANSQMYSPLRAVWGKRSDLERDNMRAALEWAVSVQPIMALRIANALADNYWYMRDAYAEGIQWYERALPFATDAPIELRAYALAYTAHFAVQLGQKTHYAEESLKLARQSDDKTLLAFALGALGANKLEYGDPQGATACFEEALPLAQATQSLQVLPWILIHLGWVRVGAGEYDQAESYFQEAADAYRASYWLSGLAECLWNLGDLAFLRGDIAKARSDLAEGLPLAREFQNKTFIGHIGETLARVRIIDGAFDDARRLLHESLLVHQDLGRKSCVAHNLEGWARLALAQGNPQRAARLLSALTAHLNRLSMSLIPLQQMLYDQTLPIVKQKLDDTAFDAAWAEGKAMALEQAIDYALAMECD